MGQDDFKYTRTKKKVRTWLEGYRGEIVILIEAKYRQSWYQNVQNCIGYTVFYFNWKFDNHQNIVLRVMFCNCLFGFFCQVT